MIIKKIVALIAALTLFNSAVIQAEVTIYNHSGSKNYKVYIPQRGPQKAFYYTPGQHDTTKAVLKNIIVKQQCKKELHTIAKIPLLGAGKEVEIYGKHYTVSSAPKMKHTLSPACDIGQ